ncbi:phosphopantetheine-binding protein [Nonomuraea sp. H19]|uniref:phosphopantetheine-binding protein n=1 Tax=Nonomuraea sp. H19 TaxID=3452206 RepID=UPI003F8CE672
MRTHVEKHVTEIWNAALGGAAGATFGELGGKALAAVRMAAEIENRLGVAIEPVALLRGATLDALLEQVTAKAS